ncbi:MAG: NAD(P)-binding domain-containing protein, partial [Gammaproteobacteria bacterium]
METLKQKIEAKRTTAAVIGLGYVGLPLAMEMASAGFKVIGIDVDKSKISTLKEGKSYILDVGDATLTTAVREERFVPTSDFSALQ